MTDHALEPTKVAGGTVYTIELLRATDGKASTLVERDLTRAVAIAEDMALLDGAAAVAGERPASILNGLTPLSGGSPADIESDVLALFGAVRDGDGVALYFAASPAVAIYLIGLRDANGQRIFPDVLATGGSIFGVPLLLSTGSPDILALIDADSILVVDEDVNVSTSRQTSVVMDDAPGAGAAQMVSLWQTNSAAIIAERFIAWRLAHTDAVAYMTVPVGSPA